MSLHNIDILNAAVGLLCFLIFFIHWMNNKKPSLANFLFRFFLLANAYYFFVAAMIQNGSILSVPHLFRSGSIAGLLSAPLVYLILIKSLKNEPWNKIDYLHFVPAILYIIDFIPFFILPSVGKLEVIENLFGAGSTATLGFEEGWIFNGTFWIIIKVLQPLVYSVICFATLYQVIGNSGIFFKNDNRKLIQLLYWLSIYLFLITIPVGLSFAGLTGSNGWEITSFFLFSLTLITCLFLLFSPEILYGIKGIWIITEENDLSLPKEELLPKRPTSNNYKNPAINFKNTFNLSKANTVVSGKRKTYLSERQVYNIEKALNTCMNDTQAYLKQGFSLPQLAEDTNYQLQQISAFLNQHKGVNFNDYINKFRINHLIDLYEQDSTILDQYTLEYLGKSVGFGSRSVFITAFKKFKGQTPSAYFNN